MDIKLANPRGFCAGVDRAIDIVDRALDMFGAPVYVRHEVVHNKFVVDNLRDLRFLSKKSVKFLMRVFLFLVRMVFQKKSKKRVSIEG